MEPRWSHLRATPNSMDVKACQPSWKRPGRYPVVTRLPVPDGSLHGHQRRIHSAWSVSLDVLPTNTEERGFGVLSKKVSPVSESESMFNQFILETIRNVTLYACGDFLEVNQRYPVGTIVDIQFMNPTRTASSLNC